MARVVVFGGALSHGDSPDAGAGAIATGQRTDPFQARTTVAIERWVT